jgi:mannose-6-phosphate isomerase-like protein (cupin superfamily)
MPQHIRPSTVPARQQTDPHVSDALTLRLLSNDPFLMHITFPANGTAQRHSHGCDMVYTLLRGSMTVGDLEVSAGDVFCVTAGEVYGPESAGPDGAEVLIHSVGGPLSTDWV